MAITLKPEQEHRVAEAIRSGGYQTPDEVLDRALDLLSEQEEWLATHRVEIAAAIEEGYDAAQRGELMDGEEVRAEMEQRKRKWLADERQT